MKRKNNLYENTYSIENILKMTDRVCKTVKNKKKVDMFETYKSEHINNIRKRLIEKNKNIGKYNIFMITDPKCRIVMAQNIEDKIINHLIAEYVLVRTFESKYTNSMAATRKNKGTTYAIKLLKKYLNEMKRKYNNFYVLKVDISKYFYRIDHEVLKDILKSKIKDKDALEMLNYIIDSTNSSYVNEEIKKLKDSRINFLKRTNLPNKEKLIEEVSEIPYYEYGKGAALGNQTSQAFGLIYLYKFNHYLKEELGLKYTINYMDDFVIIHHDKQYLQKCLIKIKKELEEKYKLNINTKKTQINSIKNGIEFLGYNYILKNDKVIMKLRKRTKERFKKRVKELSILQDNNMISKKDLKKYLNSYKGLLKWGNCGNLYYENMKKLKR